MSKLIVEVGKALGKAVVAGVGLELARLATGHMRKRFGVKDEDTEKLEDDLEKVKRENERLRREVELLKEQRASSASTAASTSAAASTSEP